MGHTPFTADGRCDHALERLAFLFRPGSGIDRAESVDRFHQLDPVGDHLFAIFGIDGRDISAVDQGQTQIGGAVPHRHRRRLDQGGQRIEGRARRFIFIAQFGDLALAVGRVENPKQRTAIGSDFLVRQPAADQKRLVRTADLYRAHKAAAGFLRQRHILHQPVEIRPNHAAGFLVQLRNMRRQMVEAEPVHQPLRGLQLAVGSNQQGQGGRSFQ